MNHLKLVKEIQALGSAWWGYHWNVVYGRDRYNNSWISSVPTQIDTSTNRMTKVTVGSELLDVGYDAAGNMTSHPGVGAFSYDAEGRLESTETISGNTRYLYDGEGRRVKKIRAASAVTYVYGADGKLLGEYGGTAEPGLVYLTMDSLGSTRMITKEGSGEAAVVSRHDYFPYGQEIPGSASYGQRINVLSYGLSSAVAQKFTGKERDLETGTPVQIS